MVGWLVGSFIQSFIHPLRKTGKKTVEEKLQITKACFVMMRNHHHH